MDTVYMSEQKRKLGTERNKLEFSANACDVWGPAVGNGWGLAKSLGPSRLH